MSAPRYNSRSPAVKRLMREAAELHQPTYNYFAQPVEDNLFEWHFTIRGPADTPFAKGTFYKFLSPIDRFIFQISSKGISKFYFN